MFTIGRLCADWSDLLDVKWICEGNLCGARLVAKIHGGIGDDDDRHCVVD
jgi:hypothetical protein